MHVLEGIITLADKNKLIAFCRRQYQSHLRVVNLHEELHTSSINLSKRILITNYSNILSILQKIHRAVKEFYPDATLTSLTLEVKIDVAWNDKRVNTFNKTTNEICAFYCGYSEDVDALPNLSFVHNDTTFQLNDVVVLQGKENLFFNSAIMAHSLIYLLKLNFNEPVLPWNNEEFIYLTNVSLRDQNIIKQNTIDYSDIENI